ncbi:MAG: bifunctional demethylmenaquinone methyltransferase/2-methoxy-6-polyprenyl-1,4-benzoquinol methylase UbiE [Opitutaceae bacterium]|nr:bifunctional demethylmenaquinone methyltransferase/2-methoxy-6-polyprenyl-1,4-benzoquinol methylase UbiE [Opitutaceae bacterium]
MPDPQAVNTMFARIARRYDVANRLLSGGLDVRWRKKLCAAVTEGKPAEVLDLATGSGDVAFALAQTLPSGAKILGMDFCEPMLDEARLKQREKPGSFDSVEFRQGDGLALPLPDKSFDAVTISFGLRNMADRHRALTEMLRVLRPGGRLYVLEFSQPARWFRGIYYFYLRRILPTLAGVLTGNKGAYDYLNDSISQFPDRVALGHEISTAGFTEVTALPLTAGTVALHSATKPRA